MDIIESTAQNIETPSQVQEEKADKRIISPQPTESSPKKKAKRPKRSPRKARKKHNQRQNKKLVKKNDSLRIFYVTPIWVAVVACILYAAVNLLSVRPLVDAAEHVEEIVWTDDVVSASKPAIVRAHDVPFSLPLIEWSWNQDSDLYKYCLTC